MIDYLPFDLTFLVLATEKTGGLFDLDGTLPLVALQFLGLMSILNIILYTPLLDILKERDSYVRGNIQTAGAKITESEKILARYKKRQVKFTRVAENHTLLWQKKFKVILDNLAQEDQKAINGLAEEVEENLTLIRNLTLLGMKNEIDVLSNEIVAKILP